jgi:hypothetical protein
MTAVRAVMKETANRGGLIFRQRGCPLGRMVSVLHFFTGGRSAGNRNQPRCQDCNDKQGSQLCEQVSNLKQRPARQEDKIASASLLSDRVVNFHEYPDLSTLRRAHVPREFGAAGARPLTCLYLLKLQKDLAVRAAIGRANPVAFCRRAISIASAGRMNCMSNDPGAKWLTDNVHVQA